MVDHKIGTNDRVDRLGIESHGGQCIPHRCQVDNRRHPGKVLHKDSRWRKPDFCINRVVLIPLGDTQYLRFGNLHAIFVSQQVFEQNLE